MNDCRFLTIAQSSASLAYHKPLLARRSEPYLAKEVTVHELKNCSGGRRGDRRICATKMPVRASGRLVTLCPKQLPWKLLAQFSLSRERDVANILA
jgi:hypothetical protein